MTNQNLLNEDFIYQFGMAGISGGKTDVCFCARASGLYRSEDGGETWGPVFGSLNLQEAVSVQTVAVSPGFEKDRDVFVGVSGGILRSIDGGQRWESAHVPSPPPVI